MEVSATTQPEHRQSLLWSMNLSMIIRVLLRVMKVGAYWLTGSERVEPFAEVHTHLEPLEEHDAAHAAAAGHHLTPPA